LRGRRIGGPAGVENVVSLPRPIGWEWLQQGRQRQLCRLLSVQDRFDDVRCQQRELQDTAEIAPLDPLDAGDLADRGVAPLV